MFRCRPFQTTGLAASSSIAQMAQRRWQSATVAAEPEAAANASQSTAGSSNSNAPTNSAAQDRSGGSSGQESALSEPKDKGRNFMVFSATAKGRHLHMGNYVQKTYWIYSDFGWWYPIGIFFFVLIPITYRIKHSQKATEENARLGENLLDERVKELLGDIERLRLKDPLRLESEANAYHDAYWKRRARNVAAQQQHTREVEMNRGVMQGEARGTDMTEWVSNKEKDDGERHVARRTQDYIQGFHHHLKYKRLI